MHVQELFGDDLIHQTNAHNARDFFMKVAQKPLQIPVSKGGRREYIVDHRFDFDVESRTSQNLAE